MTDAVMDAAVSVQEQEGALLLHVSGIAGAADSVLLYLQYEVSSHTETQRATVRVIDALLQSDCRVRLFPEDMQILAEGYCQPLARRRKSATVAEVYPNPFSSTVKMRVEQPSDGELLLLVFGGDGRAVATAARPYAAPGTHVFSFNTRDWAAGVYTVIIQHGGRFHTHRMLRLP